MVLMIPIGNFAKLRIARFLSFGAYLESEEGEEVLLPGKYLTPEMKEGDMIEVFLYCDSEDRPVATTEQPLATVGEIAFLRVKDINKFGAFLDWGVLKDLFVPYREQATPMQKDRKYLVYVYLDEESMRIAGSSKLSKFLHNKDVDLQTNQQVQIVIAEKTDLGYRVVVDNRYWGMIYEDEVFEKINIGDKRTGFVKKIREDNKIDISLQKLGYGAVDPASMDILNKLSAAGGFIPLSDKSPPEKIYDYFKMSKKTFKKAIGALYRERKILIKPDGIQLI